MTAKNRKTKSPERCGVLICGAGVPGLTLALLLADAGIDVAVIDPAPEKALLGNAPDTRTVALMKGSIGLLQRTGAWDSCAAGGGVMEALKIIDDSGLTREPVEAAFHASDVGQDIFGINMPNNLLRAALAGKALKTNNIRLLPETKFVSHEADDFGATATTSGGDIRAKIIIGADGRGSAVRACAGIDVWEHDYGQSAITCLIRHSRHHNNISTEFHRPSGPFALVPLPGNVSSVVWVDKTDAVEELLKLDKKTFVRALQERTNDLLGTIELALGPQSFPLKALKAKKLTAKRIALIAEAAHVLHPLTAQGLNLSLRDVAALTDILIDSARLGLDIGGGAVLARYETARRADVSLRVHGTDILNRLISHDRTPLHALRRAGLKAVDNVSFLKEFVMQQGMAPQMKPTLRSPASRRGRG